MNNLRFLSLSAWILTTFLSISPGYGISHTAYSNLFTVNTGQVPVGGTHTAYSNIFTVDTLIASSGGSHTAYSNLFTVNTVNTGQVPVGGNHTAYSNLFTVDTQASQPRQLSTLSLTVSDKDTGKALEGVMVQANAEIEYTNSNGVVSFTGLSAGILSLSVEAEGYFPTSRQIRVPSSSTLQKQLSLAPQTGNNTPVITKVHSKFTDSSRTSYFLSGTNRDISFKADVHWNGSPGQLQFQTSKGNWTTSNLNYKLNIKNDFGNYDRLKVIATNSDGVSSDPFDAGIEVVPPPAWLPFYWFYPKGNDDYVYKVTVLPVAPSISIDKDKIPKDIPIVGDSPIRFVDLTQEISGELSSSGAGEIGVDFAALKKIKKSVDLAKVKLQTSFNFGGYFQYVDGEGWEINGGYVEVGLDEPAYAKSPPYYFAIPPIPIPFFARGEARLEELAVRLDMLYQQQLELSGTLTMYPAVRGSIGAGVSDIASVEGYLQGGVRLIGELPANTPSEAIRELSLRLTGGLKAVLLFVTYERDFLEWEWELIENKGKRVWALVPREDKPFKMGILDRDYLNDPSYAEFVANHNYQNQGGFQRSSVSPPGESDQSVEFPIQKNVFPYSQPAIATYGKEVVNVWVADDPNDDNLNRTEIQYSFFDGSQWSTPQFLADDSLSDFRPRIIVDGSGKLLAVWERANTTLTQIENSADLTKRMEIAYSTYDPVNQEWSEPSFITTNESYDKLPQLTMQANGNVLLTWVSNSDGEVIGTESSPDIIHYSIWNGSDWTSPNIIDSDLTGLMSYSLDSNSLNTYLVISRDTDGDSLTRHDVELFFYQLTDGTWTDPVQLTNNQIPDDTPRLAVDTQDRILLIWQRDGVLFNTLNLNMSAALPVLPAQHPGVVGDLTLVSEPEGKLALVWSDNQEDKIDLYSTYFDPHFNSWGTVAPLTQDASQEYSVNGTFLQDGDLMLAYNKATIEYVTKEVMDSDGTIITQTNIPEIIQRDLYGMRHTFGHDLRISAADIHLSTDNPAPASTVKIQAIIHNNGDLAETNISVAFHDGDPAADGQPIGEPQTIAGPLLPGATDMAEVEWQIPPYQGSHRVVATVNSESAASEQNPHDNQAAILTVLPDPEISSFKAEHVGGTTWSITATVSNSGVVSAASMELVITKGTENSLELERYIIEELQAGSSQDVSIFYALSEEEINAGGINLRASLGYLGSTPDFNPGNNQAVSAIVPPEDRPPVQIKYWRIFE